jgi:hypothetical protein
VAPPEEAELARKQLPAAPSEETKLRPTTVGAPREESAIANGRVAAPSAEEQRAPKPGADSGASDWDDFLATVRSRAATSAEFKASRAPSKHVRRRSRKPLVVAVVIVVIAGSIGLAWARARSEQRAVSPRPSTAAAVQPAPAPLKSTRPAKASKQTRASKVRPTSKSSAPSKPTARPGAFVPSRIWSWVAVPGARHYLVRFFRDGRRVLSVRTSRPRLVLSKGFALRPGRYRWTVVSIPAKGTSRRPIVDSTFVVSSSGGGAR